MLLAVWADGKTKGFIKTKSLGRRYGRMGGRRVRVRGLSSCAEEEGVGKGGV